MSTKPYTLAEQIGFQVDELLALQQVAADDRRPPHVTERLIDALEDVGRSLRRLGRG